MPPSTLALRTDEVEADKASLLAILTAPASPPTGQWFEEEGRDFRLEDFNYLVGLQLSDVNRRTGATEVWVVKDIRVVSNCLVARRQRVENRRTQGPWLGPFHVRDIAVNHWLSSVRSETSLAFAPQEVDLKRPGKGPLKLSAPVAQVALAPQVTGTKRQREMDLRAQESDPLAVRVPILSSYAERSNRQYSNSDSFMSSLIFLTPSWASEVWPTLRLPSPAYHPFLRVDVRPEGMRRLRGHRGDAWLAMDLSSRALAANLGDSLSEEVRRATKIPGKDPKGPTQ